MFRGQSYFQQAMKVLTTNNFANLHAECDMPSKWEQFVRTNYISGEQQFTCGLPEHRRLPQCRRASFWHEPQPIGWETPADEGRPTLGPAHFQPYASPRKPQPESDLWQTIIIPMPMFTMLSSWYCRCESSPGSFDECSTQRQAAAEICTKPISIYAATVTTFTIHYY